MPSTEPEGSASVTAGVDSPESAVEALDVKPVVSVARLRKEFGETVAVDDLTFSILPGEIFGFIGPNGAGKTTTIRILATLLEANAGTVEIAGCNVFEEPEAVRRIIGYMPDEFGVYEGITVWEYLDFFAGAFRLSRDRRSTTIDGVLELTDLGPHRERMVSSLSKGMKQRLCLAKTLIHDPSVLILDEPASAMDPRARIELRALLKELRAMGKTILISSHILTELSDVCTSFGVIERGRLLEWGSMDSIRERLRASRQIRMLFHADCSRAVDLIATLPGVEDVRSDGPALDFEYHGPPARFHEVIRPIVENGLPLLTIRQKDSNLESLFLEVTRGELH